MPGNLGKAHAALDTAVDKLYRTASFASDRDRVEHLFGRYEALVNPLERAAAKQNNALRARRRSRTDHFAPSRLRVRPFYSPLRPPRLCAKTPFLHYRAMSASPARCLTSSIFCPGRSAHHWRAGIIIPEGSMIFVNFGIKLRMVAHWESGAAAHDSPADSAHFPC